MERRGGRQSDYDEDFIRDISLQVLIEFYNERQETLRTQIKRDPNYVSKLRSRAGTLDSTVRAWLQAVDHVPCDHPDFRREVTFRQWCLRLDPPMPPWKLTAMPMHEQDLRNLMLKHFTDEYWRVNCKRWLNAIQRVRQDKCIKLIVPSLWVESDEEEEYL